MNRISDNILVEAYNRLGSGPKVALETGIPPATVAFRLKRLGVLRKWKRDVNIDVLCEDYLKTQSLRQTGKNFGVSSEFVREKLGALGLVNEVIRYTCNDSFFSADTISSFYWAGFIAADGCVKLKNNKYKQVSIGLNNRDHVHLEKFKSAIDFSGPISIIERSDCVVSEICISSDRMFEDLSRFNIVPRKSLVLTFPEWIVNHAYLNHFLRGYSDGDGSFYMSKDSLRGKKTDQLMFGLRGTKNFLIFFERIIREHCGSKEKLPRLNNGIFSIGWGGNRLCIKIRDFLYSNSIESTRLDRKYEITHTNFLNALPRNLHFKRVIGTNIQTGKQMVFESMKEAGVLGFEPQGISACCRGEYSHHKGYTWRYADQIPTTTDITNTSF